MCGCVYLQIKTCVEVDREREREREGESKSERRRERCLQRRMLVWWA